MDTAPSRTERARETYPPRSRTLDESRRERHRHSSHPASLRPEGARDARAADRSSRRRRGTHRPARPGATLERRHERPRNRAIRPADATESPNLIVVEANLLSLDDEALQLHLRGCDAVISCLGHVLSFKGVFSPPRDLVSGHTTRLCRGIEAPQPARPVKVILMSSVSVPHPGGLDIRRGILEQALVWMLLGLLPPARDDPCAVSSLRTTPT